MNNFIYDIKTKVVFGTNNIDEVGSYVKELNKKNVLLMYGKNSIKVSGLYDVVVNSLKAQSINVYDLANVKPNPSIDSVRKGQEMIKAHNIDFVLAVGGGSVIDCAKAVCASAFYEGDPWDFLIEKASVTKALPLGTVLTLAATGSEMNTGSVISNELTQEKLAFGSDLLRPVFTFEDPTLMFTLPKYQTAAGAVDIVAHLLEQYFNHHQDDALSDRLIEAMLINVIDFANKACDCPDDYKARANLMWTSSLALNGLTSCGKAGGDWASHMIEHEVSAIYDVTHGAGLAILFPSVLTTYLEKDIQLGLPLIKFTNLARNVFKMNGNLSDEQLATDTIKAFSEFFISLGMPSKLSQEDVDAEHFMLMAEKAIAHSEIGHYHPLNTQDIFEIFVRCQ